MGEIKPPGADDRLLVLELGLSLAPGGAVHPSQQFRPELRACANLPDPLGVRGRRQRHSSENRATRCLTHPSLQVRVARKIAMVSARRRSAAAAATASDSPESSTSVFGSITIQLLPSLAVQRMMNQCPDGDRPSVTPMGRTYPPRVARQRVAA
jgi:hypothetical protein